MVTLLINFDRFDFPKRMLELDELGTGTLTAWQSSSLSASTPLTVLVGHIGYGNAVVLQQGTSSKAPATDGSGSFQVSCVPEASEWLSLDNTGVISLKSGAGTGGSLTDQSGTNLGRGGVCSVQHGTRQEQVMVLAPNAWSSISYSYGASTVLYATVGERSPLLPVKGGSGVAPSRYSASCAGGAFAFDELTGVATWEGHEIFALDVKTGDLQVQPEHSLTKTLDATDVDAVRRKINLQCTIFGHYEWLPAGQGPVLTHSLQLEFRDQTCWAKKKLSFAHRHHKGSRSKNDCRSLCRSDATCSHFQLLNNECYFLSGICKRPNDMACQHKEQWVYEHYPGCGERGSCIDIKGQAAHRAAPFGSERAMPTGSDEPAEAADPASLGVPPSTLPWNQIPRFDPATTDLRIYTQKLQFLQAIWPEEHLAHLAPRAALMVEGAAFQKLARIDASKLRSANGIKVLIEALGGQWGRTDAEDKLDLFERALFTVCQKADETNDSYLARHDIAFEDLLAKQVTIADIRAYILVRQSTLSPEDRKRIVVENDGKLTYEGARRSMRILGSKFFQELQGTRGSHGKKTYEAYQTDEVEDNAAQTFMSEMDSTEMDEEQAFQLLADQGDEDAAFVAAFEDQIIDSIQDHQELAQCFVSYQEARARVRERARSRGFWPISTKGKGKNKSGKKGKSAWNVTPGSSGGFGGGRRRSLADRIANSSCRICGQPGHWKRECPQRGAEQRKPEVMTATAEINLGLDDEGPSVPEVIDSLPDDATSWSQDRESTWSDVQHGCIGGWVDCHVCVDQGLDSVSGFVSHHLRNKLIHCCRKHGIEPVVPSMRVLPREPSVPTPAASQNLTACHSVLSEHPAPVFHVEEACHEAIIDTGASRAVIGSERLEKLVESCGVQRDLKMVPSSVNFRFGNSGTLQSTHAVFFPRKTGGWIRVEVVPGRTPFLLSNSVLKALRAVEHLDRILTYSVDPRLNTHHEYPEAVSAEIQRPPDITTLRQWGQQVIPSGKQAGKSFEEARNVCGYARQLWNRKAVSAWVRSFQMYCRARSVEDAKQIHSPPGPVTGPTEGKVPAQGTTAMTKDKIKSKPETSSSHQGPADQGWITIDSESSTSSEINRKPKRGVAGKESKAMTVEPNQERVQALKTQIAILQRELARETKIPENDGIPEEEDI
eukprot:s1807_g11.t2